MESKETIAFKRSLREKKQMIKRREESLNKENDNEQNKGLYYVVYCYCFDLIIFVSDIL